jgi:hypothetical protein
MPCLPYGATAGLQAVIMHPLPVFSLGSSMDYRRNNQIRILRNVYSELQDEVSLPPAGKVGWAGLQIC